MLSRFARAGASSAQERREFNRKITRLMLPIVVQNLLGAAVNSADVVMLNYVGQTAIAAVSLATQYSNILFMAYYGLGTGVTILCAQYYGKGDLRAVRAVEGIALRFALGIAAVVCTLALAVPEAMMRFFTGDAALIGLGAVYLRWVSAAWVCSGIAEVYLAVLRSTGHVTAGTALNALAFCLNILLNAVFIFGLFGAPRLGAAGVAIATSLSRIIELAGCFAVSALGRVPKLDPAAVFLRSKALFGDFVRLSLPALANDIVWSMAYSVFSAILGHLSSDAVAANSFVTVVRNFATVLCFGLASAGGILLGHVIGEGRLEQARRDGSRLLRLTVLTGAIGGVLVLAAMPFVLRAADITPQAREYLRVMLLINSYYVMGAAVNTMLIAGAFRAGGDSRFGFVCDTVIMWGYAVPLGLLAAFVLRLPVMWVYFLLCTDEFAKWPGVLHHYFSGRWLKNITRSDLDLPDPT